ncbi:CaiB/BaiF CoA transferase family protein [Halovenus marina]|uniref:CaiB/BaiF CoA transferase family protein n=1 Tax=Halovenus marina TaxID=3396621 RepID=UPI003F56EC7B
MTAPFEDINVVEVTQMVAGSHAGMILADLGADVVKIERPETGEIARGIDPEVGGESFYYMSVNRGKQSVALDLKSEEGQEALLSLLKTADVFIENLSPGTVEGLGIGYETVRERNPDIVYCSVSAFGQTGPYAERRGIDTMVQSYAGIPSLTRGEDGHPLRVGLPVADLAGAMYATVGIMAALRRRDQTGEGDYLDTALSDSLLAFLSVRAGYSFATEKPFPSIAKSHVYFVPEGIFPTADGYVQLSVVTEEHWGRFCSAIDREELRSDPSYETVADRRTNRERLNSLLSDVFRERPTEEWLDRFEAADVPAQRIHDALSVWDAEHTRAREMIAPVETPGGESYRTVDYPVKHRSWNRTPNRYIAPLGADTRDALRDVGFTEDEIDALADRDVI